MGGCLAERKARAQGGEGSGRLRTDGGPRDRVQAGRERSSALGRWMGLGCGMGVARLAPSRGGSGQGGSCRWTGQKLYRKDLFPGDHVGDEGVGGPTASPCSHQKSLAVLAVLCDHGGSPTTGGYLGALRRPEANRLALPSGGCTSGRRQIWSKSLPICRKGRTMGRLCRGKIQARLGRGGSGIRRGRGAVHSKAGRG